MYFIRMYACVSRACIASKGQRVRSLGTEVTAVNFTSGMRIEPGSPGSAVFL